jgi:ribosome biogenesis GTPase
VLIDTPGLRSLGLGGGVAVDAAFPEIENLAGECRFSDCRHQDEPGCAVVAAMSAGELDVGRLASYRKLQREVAARADPLLRKAELSLWKARTRSAKLNAKRKNR